MRALNTILVIAVVTVGIAAALGPKILHAIDRGETRVRAEQILGEFQPPSRNLVVEGRLGVEFRVDKTVTDDQGHTKDRRSYYPLVGPGWSPAQPLHVVFAAHAWPGYGEEELAAAPIQRGVLRDIWWEGVPDSVAQKFALLGLHVAEDVRLVEAPQ